MNNFDRYVRKILGALPAAVQPGAILAGGALRSFFDGTEVKDYDIFFRTHEEYVVAVDLFNCMRTAAVVGNTPLAPSFSLPGFDAPFNLIGFRHAEPAELVEQFDFTACAMAAYIDNDVILYIEHPAACVDAKQKILTVNRVRPTRRLLQRAARYIDRYGYMPGDLDDFVDQLRNGLPMGDDPNEPVHSDGG